MAEWVEVKTGRSGRSGGSWLQIVKRYLLGLGEDSIAMEKADIFIEGSGDVAWQSMWIGPILHINIIVTNI